MTNVIEVDCETLFYIEHHKELVGVCDKSAGIEFISDKFGMVHINSDGNINHLSKEKFKNLCIAWLALEYPEVLKYDNET